MMTSFNRNGNERIEEGKWEAGGCGHENSLESGNGAWKITNYCLLYRESPTLREVRAEVMIMEISRTREKDLWETTSQ